MKCYNQPIPRKIFNQWMDCFRTTGARFIHNPHESDDVIRVSYEIDNPNDINRLNHFQNQLASEIVEKKRPAWRRLVARYFRT